MPIKNSRPLRILYIPMLGLCRYKENPMRCRIIGNLLIPALAGILVAETMTEKNQPVHKLVCPQCKTAISAAFGWCPQCVLALRTQTKTQACA
jgi:hypothetical protein